MEISLDSLRRLQHNKATKRVRVRSEVFHFSEIYCFVCRDEETPSMTIFGLVVGGREKVG